MCFVGVCIVQDIAIVLLCFTVFSLFKKNRQLKKQIRNFEKNK